MRKLKSIRTDPPGGWYFKVPETGAEITAGNYWKLRTFIQDHYVANDLTPPDDLEDQIHDQICVRSPENFCTGDGGFALSPDLRVLDKGTRTVIKTIKQTEDGKEKLGTSVDRIPICVSCRFNNNRVGCFRCTDTYKFCRQAFKDIAEMHDGMLKHCDIFEAFGISLCCASPEVLRKLFGEKDLDMIPDNCWIKSYLKGNEDG